MNTNWNRVGLVTMGVVTPCLLAIPGFVSAIVVFDLTLYALMAILAMSLAVVWGYGGILSFGQVLFFGLGGYSYAIAAINLGDTTSAIALAMLISMGFAALLGYFMFWGQISDVYLAVTTLTISLILGTTINSMSGTEHTIGSVPIGGYNGISGIPPVSVPFSPDHPLDFVSMYYLSIALMLITYFGLRWIFWTRFGRIVVSIRENETRAQLIGHDVRRFKLGIYVIGAGLSGLAGGLYAAWSGLINPDVFGVAFAAQVIVWVILGGLGTLIGPILGSVGIQALILWLGKTRLVDANIALGILFIVFVLLVPAGLMPKLQTVAERVLNKIHDKERS